MDLYATKIVVPVTFDWVKWCLLGQNLLNQDTLSSLTYKM